MANLVFIVYLSTHDLEMACVTEPESQGMVIPGNQSLRKEEGRQLGECCWPFFPAYSPRAPDIPKHPSHCLSGRLERAGHKPHFLCNSTRWALPAPGLFLPLFPYVVEDWKHASQRKPSGYLPVSRGGSLEEPAAGLAGLQSAWRLLLGSHQVNCSSPYCLSVACGFQTPVGI